MRHRYNVNLRQLKHYFQTWLVVSGSGGGSVSGDGGERWQWWWCGDSGEGGGSNSSDVVLQETCVFLFTKPLRT